jgi:hypothetical protein
VLPSSKFKDGAALATALPKATLRLLAHGAGWDVAHLGPEHEEAEHEEEDHEHDEEDEPDLLPGEHADEVVAKDLTFEGRFDPKSSKYVVHAVVGVMVPPAAEAAMAKLAKGAAGAAAAVRARLAARGGGDRAAAVRRKARWRGRRPGPVESGSGPRIGKARTACSCRGESAPAGVSQ